MSGSNEINRREGERGLVPPFDVFSVAALVVCTSHP